MGADSGIKESIKSILKDIGGVDELRKRIPLFKKKKAQELIYTSMCNFLPNKPSVLIVGPWNVFSDPGVLQVAQDVLKKKGELHVIDAQKGTGIVGRFEDEIVSFNEDFCYGDITSWEKQYKLAKEHLFDLPEPEILHADIRAAKEYDDEKFDLVYDHSTMYFVGSNRSDKSKVHKKVLDRYYQLLKPGGRAYMMTNEETKCKALEKDYIIGEIGDECIVKLRRPKRVYAKYEKYNKSDYEYICIEDTEGMVHTFKADYLCRPVEYKLTDRFDGPPDYWTDENIRKYLLGVYPPTMVRLVRHNRALALLIVPHRPQKNCAIAFKQK